MLADITIAGAPRKVIMQASKNGFFYVLDRQTGQLISAKAFVNGITWATGIDPGTGRPQESPSAHDGLQAVLFLHRLVADITGTPWRFILPLASFTSRHEKTRSSSVPRTKTGSRTPRFGIAVRMPPTIDQSRKKHSLLRP